MKKLLLAVLLCASSGVWANAQYKATSICEFDYDAFNFCTQANLKKYQAALKKQAPNFNTKYILLNVGSAKAIRYVAIDTQDGLVIPLRDTILGFKDEHGDLTGKPPKINYSINQPNLCISGSIDAYRDAYDNIELCYTIEKDQFSKHGRNFTRLDIPKSLEN
ncbi:hypothetical protein EC844_12434 [Acinetobacter calcoaceticus]|uniref:Uncharacterized protein n=1 Tax=Acinetobacter calcoaceticus TaxID=471 RepID=A0A4R1XHL0_ACICA|nr:hypothetical protein EC844_12434 [Acinetobacter calcoaceticus]